MQGSYEFLPDELKRRGLFCTWQAEQRNGRMTKIPYNAVSGQRAKSNDESCFTSFEKAAGAAGYSGIGVGIFHGICAVDLDCCVDENGAVSDKAKEIVKLMHSYTEYSPSGTGLHILFLAENYQYDTDRFYIMNHASGIEVYVAGVTNKFVTVTGNEIRDHYPFESRTEELNVLLERYMTRTKTEPKETARNAINARKPMADRELIIRAERSRNGEAFRKLMSGDWKGDFSSQSEADMVLCSMLAFWTGANAWQMDHIFRHSGLMRGKWDSPRAGSTYGADTIQKAIDSCKEVYTPGNTSRGIRSCEARTDGDERTGTVTQEFCPLVLLKPQQNELPPFPVECLPEHLRNYVSAVAEHSQTSPDMAAVIGLGVLAVCLQGKYQVQGNLGYCEPLSLYTVVIASPGERKSSVMKDMTKYLYDYEHDFNESHAEEIRANKQKREDLERQIAGLQKKLENKRNPQMENELHELETQLEQIPEMKPARFFADDCSSEALTSLIASSHGIFSVISTEGGIFDIMAGRYSGKANLDVWLKGHCGDAIRVDRMGREPEYIPHPALSAILSIQPSVLDEIMSNTTMNGRGLIARFLYSTPPSRIGTRVFRTNPIPPEVDAAYKNLIYQLMAQGSSEAVQTVVLSPEAEALISDYFEEHERFLIGEGQGIADWACKYIGSVLRIAGLLHLANCEKGQLEITVTVMRNAISIGKYFLAHAMYAYSMMGTDLSIQKARFVWGRLKKKNVRTIKRSDLFQMCRGKFFKKTEEIQPTLDLLAGDGYIRIEEPERSSVGRPADMLVVINPEAMKLERI